MKQFFVVYFGFTSIKSFKCKRSAVTEMLISQNEIPKEISKQSKLSPNK